MPVFQMRKRAALSVCAIALALAGCNAQRGDELAANVATGANVEAGNAPAGAGPQTATVANAAIAEAGVPIPPVRPDFAKLAKEQSTEAGKPQTAVAAADPAGAGEPAAQAGTTVMARSPADLPATQRPTGIFAVFAGTPSDPAAGQETAQQQNAPPVQMAAAPQTTASDASPAQRASIGAYERRIGGDDPPDTPAPASYRITPGATVEINGVTRQLPNNASPVLIAPSPQVAASFGSIGGQRWRPAYDNVVTSCFPSELRRALDIIGQHFNSEVLVTSGARTNGRRKSMHRSCRAADIRIVGVSPGTVARYAASVPGINGIGTYRRVAVTHIDTRENRMAWRY